MDEIRCIDERHQTPSKAVALLRISQTVDDAQPANRPDSFHLPSAEIKQPSENGPVVNLYILLSLVMV